MTGCVAWLERDPTDDNTMLWNPDGISWRRVLAGLNISDGVIAVTGGQRVFDLFLPGFTSFDLVTVARMTIPDGLPCFSTGRPWDVLAASGMRAGSAEELDAGVTRTTWHRD